ncbi:MAG: hypothetical protein Unbinned706contig1001_29 [Prokaryotic dsDNA virus sp.]|nr:MAG: hypothetical protein Unbinned706contig1001_29 [Prokaryotic dsDNA virus sp.]|tara:strand:- start:26020 stop:26298 length:279 start_codon:yes stop_codon:yes gene_type:complete
MKYYIVEKQHIKDSVLKYDTIGYVDTLEDKQYIEQNWEIFFEMFISDNRVGLQDGTVSILEFFNERPYSYIVDIELENIVGMALEKININNL